MTFNQVDFAYTLATIPNSDWGTATVDVAALASATGISGGFLNVHSSFGWVIQNLPVDPSSGYSTIGTSFNLGTSGSIVTRVLNLSVEYTASPISLFSGNVTNPFALPPTNDVVAAEGYGAGSVTNPGAPPPVRTLAFPGASTELNWQPGHPNVQTADDQCAPMAVANSLAWLNTAHPGSLRLDPHVMGLGPDGSLVGQLETDMGRTFRNRRDGDGIGADSILEGKFEYLDRNKPLRSLVTKHFDPGKDEIVGDFTRHKRTSADRTTAGDTVADLVKFICSEIKAGEDVELGYLFDGGGGHFVDLTGCGFILGIPYVTFVEDADQTNDTRGLRHWFSLLVDTDGDGRINFDGRNHEVSFVISESIPQPRALALLGFGLVLLWVLGRRRRPGVPRGDEA
ncbi:MAG: hypothetical protein HYY95_17430 [Candidatus Rokubacteria bacterium]|nr:hypothetical protein [Candidatus Rokubacteria bacterium]MBI3107319.1 hypothetical protein [Candidatus Rokubacteria bacterium]